MRRSVVVTLGVMIALAASASALAVSRPSTHHYNGTADPGKPAGVEVAVRFVHGVPAKVLHFEWHNIPAQCSGYGSTATTDSIFPVGMTVDSHHRFGGSGRFNGGRARTTVSGGFSRQNERAAGTFRVRGTVSGCRTVDTGVVHWTAKLLHPR